MQSWHELIGKLKVWKRRGQRAPHKPLLILQLLARAQRGESPAVPFSEVDKKLEGALREFGPDRKNYHPEFPFWYLKNDGFWIVRDADSIPYKRKSQPTRKTLLTHEVVGEVPPAMWKQLTERPEIITDLARIILDEYWPETYHRAIADYFGLNLEHRPLPGKHEDIDQVLGKFPARRLRDPEFRAEVLRAYERRCAFCGFDGRLGDALIGIQAAHIKWHAYGGIDKVENGLALCPMHHIAFDRGALSLDHRLRVRVSSDLCGGSEVGRTLIRLNGTPLQGPQDPLDAPAMEFIEWHRKHVFHGPERRL